MIRESDYVAPTTWGPYVAGPLFSSTPICARVYREKWPGPKPYRPYKYKKSPSGGLLPLDLGFRVRVQGLGFRV